MGAIVPITIDDGKAIPESHIFSPVASNPPHYFEHGTGSDSAIGEPEIVLSMKRANSSSVINKAKITLRLPVLEATDSSGASGYVAPPAVAYYLQANLDFQLPSRCTEDQRKDVRVLLKNLLADAQVVDLVDSLEAPY